jgi:ATP-dependent protease HslVU (ClpYQ) peptidase subunit
VKESKEQAQHGSTVLAIVNGQIYEIDEDYAWVRDMTGIYSFGSGGDYAIGAMYTKSGGEISNLNMSDVQKLIRDSLHIAAKLDIGSGPPFHILSQSAR